MTVQVFAPIAAPTRVSAVVSFASGAEFERLLGDPALIGAVLLSDGIPTADQESIAQVVARSKVLVIEVRAGGWDGVSGSPVSAACRGVISGFGENGIRTAIGLLEEAYRVGRESTGNS